MKTGINISIKQRIYLSFSLLVCLFVFNGIITIITLNSNKKLSVHLSKEVEPSLQVLEDFGDVLADSKMYMTNWVFLRFNEEDKGFLRKLHDSVYPALKSRINLYAAQWENKSWTDSLHKVYAGFEELLAIEKNIMTSLKEFRDYDDPVIKLEAERKVEEDILPRTAALRKSLNSLHALGVVIRTDENIQLEASSMKLRIFIIALAITIIFAGFFLSVYMTKVIIGPVNRIRHIINKLGFGIIQKINHHANSDEIGKMVSSVNNLSEKLEAAATFAQETGLRNFDIPFKPLSDGDVLGKALLAMRGNIKSSDERMTEAQHIAKLGSWEWDLKTNDLFWSDETHNIFDTDPRTFSPSFEGYMSFVHPEDREYTHSLIAKCLQDHEPFSNELRIINNKNVIKLLFAQGKVILNHKGEVIKMYGTGQDITERKKAEKDLADVNRELNVLFNSIDETFFSVNMATLKVIQVSPTCEKLYGYAQAEFLADYRLWFDIIHPDDKHVIENEDEQMQRGEQVNNQYRIIRKNKSIRWVETKITPTLDKEGKLLRVDGVTRDITHRKNAEEELHKSEERYRQIFETAQEGIWLIDENNYIIFFNKKMCEILGYSAEEMKGKQLFDFMDDEGREKALSQVEKRRQRVDGNYDVKYITKSGKPIWTNISTNSIFGKDGKYNGALAMVTDITQRKLDEELLLQSEVDLAVKNKELERKNKELEQFAYVASHDLQEPLRTMTSFVEIFKKQYLGKLDSKADSYLSYIVQASDRMSLLIKDLLDFSRIGHNKDVERVDCNLLLHDVLTDLGKAIKGSDAEIEAESLPVISGYDTELKQLFQNLIFNSIKFRKKNVPLRITISARKKNDYWRFAFTDNGIGIDRQHNERIFIIFQRLHTRSEYPGSGIGLSHCKKIVELHHGKIWVESILNEGSTFYFTIHSPKQKINEPKTELYNAY